MNKIYLIYMPSPLQGLIPVYGAGRKPFRQYQEDDYVDAVQAAIDKRGLDWEILRDDTESDTEKLRTQGAALLVCLPGLRLRFHRGCFDKSQMIYLNTMEYATNDVRPVMSKLRELKDAESP